jgi:hypothetical protein
MTNTAAAKATATDTETRACACTCGLQVTGKSRFRQGHDAKMVSRMVTETIQGNDVQITADAFVDGSAKDDIQHVIDGVTTAVVLHHGDRLADKYNQAAMNGWAKESAKADRQAKRAAAKQAKAEAKAAKVEDLGDGTEGDAVVSTGTVKVGRWEYPTQTLASGQTFRNTKRDGSGDWTEVAA